MKSILKITGLLLVSISMLNATECTSEKKAQMIMNGIEQSVIDEMCSPKDNNTAQQPVQIIINNSSSSDNTNTNTNTNTVAPALNNDSNSDVIKRDRMYISLRVGNGSGQYATDNDYYTYTSDISGSTASFSLGYVFDSNNRLEIASSSVTVDEMDYTVVEGVDFNWIWTMGNKKIKSGNLRPYLLLGLGNYTITRSYKEDITDAIGVNFGLGIMYPVGDSVEIDLGYHSKTVMWEETEGYNASSIFTTIDLTGLNLALRFKF